MHSSTTLTLLLAPLAILGAAMPEPTAPPALAARLTTLGVPCTVTKVVGEPVQDFIKTIYQSTDYETAATDCAGCKLKVVTRTVEYFAPYTATTVLPVTTQYDWVCLPRRGKQ